MLGFVTKSEHEKTVAALTERIDHLAKELAKLTPQAVESRKQIHHPIGPSTQAYLRRIETRVAKMAEQNPSAVRAKMVEAGMNGGV